MDECDCSLFYRSLMLSLGRLKSRVVESSSLVFHPAPGKSPSTSPPLWAQGRYLFRLYCHLFIFKRGRWHFAYQQIESAHPFSVLSRPNSQEIFIVSSQPYSKFLYLKHLGNITTQLFKWLPQEERETFTCSEGELKQVLLGTVLHYLRHFSVNGELGMAGIQVLRFLLPAMFPLMFFSLSGIHQM